MSKPSQDQIDRACEWTVERYPDLDGPAFDAKVTEALRDIVVLDSAADTSDVLVAVWDAEVS